MKNIIIGPGVSGGGGGGAIHEEIPTDNGDGTYTFTNVPISVFIEGVLAEEGASAGYTLSGLTLTTVSPSGTGLNVRGLYSS